MLQIFRMLQLMTWYEDIKVGKKPSKVKQRVKLRRAAGVVPSPLNPIVGSPSECFGTIIKISGDKAEVQWDNNHRNKYPLWMLMIRDFPLKFMPKLIKMNDSNPNITFKELEQYKIMEKEWYEHEERMKLKEKQQEERVGIELI